MRLPRRRVNAEPEPPRNVRVRLANGTEVPLECRYDGQDPEGQHVWTAIYPVEIESVRELNGLSLSIDVMPPKTSVGLEVVLPEGHSER